METQTNFMENILSAVENDHKCINSVIFIDPFYFKVVREYLNSLEAPEEDDTVEKLTDPDIITKTIEKCNSRFLKRLVTPTQTIPNGIVKVLEAYDRIYAESLRKDMPSDNEIKLFGTT